MDSTTEQQAVVQTALAHRVQVVSGRFRATLTILVMLILGLLISMLYLTYSLQLQNKQLLNDQVNQEKQLKSAVAELERHQVCIATFFAQADRTSKVIADLNNCNIKAIQQPQATPQPSSNTTTKSTGVPLGQGHAGTANAATPGTGTTSGSRLPGTTTPSPTPAPAPTPQPVTILNVPLCVPLTKVCLTN